MIKSYRVGIIGRTGKGNYGHGLDAFFGGLPNIKVVAVADENEEGRAAAVKTTRAGKSYGDYRQMLDQERLDIVAVTPRWPDCHHDMVLAAVQRGFHIFLEKPFCRTLEEADEMVAACERHNVKLAIAHHTRYDPCVDRVKQLINEGRIGDLIELRGRGKEDGRAGGEDLMVLGTHIMDLIRYIAGDASWCFARVLEDGYSVTGADVRNGNEGIGPMAGNAINAIYGMSGNATAYFATVAQQGASSGRFGLRVLGTKGVIDITVGAVPSAMILDDPTWASGRSRSSWAPVTSQGVGRTELARDCGPYAGRALIVRDLTEAIEHNRQPRGSAHDGRAALEMILATYESHRMNGPVELPLKNRKHPLTLL
jgi:predicted dehydrogenase